MLVLLPLSASALTLHEGLLLVTERGRDVSIAAAEQDAARSAVSVARAPGLPWVDFYGRETWLKNQPMVKTPNGAFAMQEDQSLSYGVKVTQVLYDFGKTSSAVDASKELAAAKDANALRARNRASIEFIFAYLDLLEADKLLAVALDETKRYEAHQKDAEARQRAGVVTRNEVLQAQVLLADSLQRQFTAENNRAQRAAAVNSMLLRPLAEPVQAEEAAAPAAAEVTLDEAWKAAEAENHEVRELQARIRAKEESNRAVRAEYYPSLYVAGGYDYTQNRYQVYEDNWSLIAGVNVNLMAGGVTKARLSVGEGELRALVAMREKYADQVRLEVQRNYLELQSARKKVEAARTAVEQAVENLRLQRLRYREGVGTSTEVLDAVTLNTSAQTNAWRAHYGMRRAEAGLLYVMGRDLPAAYGK